MGLDITGLGGLASFGKEIINSVKEYFPTAEAKASAELKVMELAQSGKLQEMANNTEIYKIEVDDRKNARTIHTKFVDILAVVSLGGSTYILYNILFAGLNEKISDMVAGMIIAVFVNNYYSIMQYYFGSSASSAKKNEAMATAIQKK